MKSATVIAFIAAMSVAGAYAAEPAKPAAAGDTPAAMGDKAMPMQKMDGCAGMNSADPMKGDSKDAQGMGACKDGMSADHMQKMHEHMQDMHGSKDGMQGMDGMKSMGGMPKGDAAAKEAKPKATAKKGDKAAPPACDGKDSKGKPCAANVAPADEVDHAAHHPQTPAK